MSDVTERAELYPPDGIMNLLLINYEFPPLGAGASTATWHIGKELTAMGHDITVLTSGFKKHIGYDFIEGMSVFRCPAVRKKTSESNIIEMFSFVASAFFFLPWLVIKHRIKGCIVFFSFPCGPLGLWANLLFKIPYVISLRGGDVPGNENRLNTFHRILTPLRRLILKRSKAVVANSKGLQQLALKADPIEVSIIPNGIDTQFFKPLVSKKKNPCPELVFLGRLSEQKNLFFLIKQLSILKNNKSLDFLLHIAGDGPIKNELQQYAKNIGIIDRIKWHGWLSKIQVLELLQRSDCFINPSLYEGMPNAVLEAMACGLPVIASNVAGNNDVVINGETGFLFDLDDDQNQNLIGFIESIIKDHVNACKTGRQSTQMVRNTYSWEMTAGRYMALLCQA